MAGDGLTVRQYFRQLRAADFARDPEQLDQVRRDVDRLTAPHYPDPLAWWGPIVVARSVKENTWA